MVWTGQTFSVGQVLTAAQMNNLQNDITALANGDSGAPSIQTAALADGCVTPIKEEAMVSGTLYPSDAASDGQEESNSTSWIKLKEVYVPRSGTYSVVFDFRQSGSSANAVYARIYVNGVATGATRTKVLDATYTTYTEDITLTPGDLCQIYIQSPAGSPSATVRNFRVRSDEPHQFVSLS